MSECEQMPIAWGFLRQDLAALTTRVFTSQAAAAGANQGVRGVAVPLYASPVPMQEIAALKAERDALKAELDALYQQEPIMERTQEGWLFNKSYVVGTKLYAGPVPSQVQEMAALKAELEALHAQEPCGYMWEEAGITTVFNAKKCVGEMASYTPVYKRPVPAQQAAFEEVGVIDVKGKHVAASYSFTSELPQGTHTLYIKKQ